MSTFYVLKGILFEGLDESVRYSMLWYGSTYPVAALYDLSRHATSLLALQKGSVVGSEKESDYRENAEQCPDRRENPPMTVNVS